MSDALSADIDTLGCFLVAARPYSEHRWLLRRDPAGPCRKLYSALQLGPSFVEASA